MAGIQHRDAGGEIDIFIAFDIGQGGVLRAPGKEVAHNAHPARGSGKTTLMEFIVAHNKHPLAKVNHGTERQIRPQGGRAGCSRRRPWR